MSNFQVRTCTPADADRVGAVIRASYATLLVEHYDSDLLLRSLPLMTAANCSLIASGKYYVAESTDGQIAGCGGWSPDSPDTHEATEGLAHIRHFATDPCWARRGIAKALLAHCIARAADEFIYRFESRALFGAEAFYASAGFVARRKVDIPLRDGLSLPATLMDLDLRCNTRTQSELLRRPPERPS
jgi:GNAT superfamily N-acetyltransferase